MIRLLDCSSGKEKYVGTIETEALYEYDIDEHLAAKVKDLIKTWKDRRSILENDAISTIEWNGETLKTDMLLRDICIDGKKIPLYMPEPNEPFILRYWIIQ
jgi:hypothetical protein